MTTTSGLSRVSCGGEDAAFYQLNAHRLEVIGAHRVANAGPFIFRVRSAFNDESRVIRHPEWKSVRHGDRSDAGQAPDLLLQLFEEARHLMPIGVVDRDLHREQVARLEARVNLQHPPEALDEQTSANQQRQRQGDFADHQHTAQPLAAPG